MHLRNVEGDQAFVDRLCRQVPVRLLEPLADLAEASRAVIIVNAVIGDPVDEKERKDLDTLALERAFLLQVLLNGLMDLRFHNVVALPASLLTEFQKPSLVELDVFGARRAIDILDDVAVAVRLALIRFHIQIIALLDPKLCGLWAGPALLVYLNARADAVAVVGLDKLYIGVVEVLV